MKPIIAVALGVALLSCARTRARDDGDIRRALAAIEMCYHWAGEAGSGDAERERQVRQGAERDCGQARKLATEAQRASPDDPALALGILQLADVGAYELSENQKARLCARAAEVAGRDSSASAGLLPDHATLCGRR